jgi:tRNA pseudouridine55 synthase
VGGAVAGPHGLCVVDKPTGWTSHDVVAKSRGLLGTRKVGHSGTLDPLATGVLVLGVGRGTRLLTFLTGLAKSYRATIRFGIETDSLDADGTVVATHDMAPPGRDEVDAAAAALTGDLMQVPPMVSAIKVGGRRLHELAREGTEVERAPRPVTVTRFATTPTEDPMVWEADVDCSSGTYVRVLAADLGHALGGGAHLVALRRTSVGPFGLDEAVPLDALAPDALLPTSAVTRVLASCAVDGDVAVAVGHGKVLEAEVLGLATDPAQRGTGPWAVLGPDGDLLAVYDSHRGTTVKPSLVLA